MSDDRRIGFHTPKPAVESTESIPENWVTIDLEQSKKIMLERFYVCESHIVGRDNKKKSRLVFFKAKDPSIDADVIIQVWKNPHALPGKDPFAGGALMFKQEKAIRSQEVVLPLLDLPAEALFVWIDHQMTINKNAGNL